MKLASLFLLLVASIVGMLIKHSSWREIRQELPSIHVEMDWGARPNVDDTAPDADDFEALRSDDTEFEVLVRERTAEPSTNP